LCSACISLFQLVLEPRPTPIHEYCYQLCEVNFKNHFYDICDYFLTPLHKAIFGLHPHQISPRAIKALQKVGYWYMNKYYTYVRRHGATWLPHFFPKYVPNKLLAKEVTYQTVNKGVVAYLSKKIKIYWPNFPIHISQYSLLNKKHTEKEAKTLKEICLCTGDNKGNDPQNVVYDHLKAIKLSLQTTHEVKYVEDIFRGALHFEEVLNRLPSDLTIEQLHKE
jgi:hypothetical protein